MNILDALPSVLGAAAVLPALIYLMSITLLDNRPEPVRAIVGCFFLAGLSSHLLQLSPHNVMLWSHYVADVVFPMNGASEWSPPGLVWTLAQSIIDIAIPEESLKLLILIVFARRYMAFNHPMEGVVYGAAVGLGLAAHENLIVAAYLPGEWLDHSVIRSVLTVPVHGTLGIIAGVYVARARFGSALGAGRRPYFRLRTYLAAWLVPIILHALYNLPLLLVRNLVGRGDAYVHFLQTAGFVVGTLVILAGARLVYRVSMAQATSSGRFGSGSIVGYRSWRLDVVGGFSSLLGALLLVAELRDVVRTQTLDIEHALSVTFAAALIALAAGLHYYATMSVPSAR